MLISTNLLEVVANVTIAPYSNNNNNNNDSFINTNSHIGVHIVPLSSTNSTNNSATTISSSSSSNSSTSINSITTISAHVLEAFAKYRLLRQPGSRPSRHLPDTLIIGVKKSGTRALLEFIRLHPDVRAAGCEVHFFDRHYQRGLHWYRHHMPYTIEGQITMEKTPSYFVTKDVPHRVHKMNASTK